MRLSPSSSLLRFACVLLALGVAASIWEEVSPLWAGAALVLICAAAVDAAYAKGGRAIVVERRLPSRFALGVAGEVEITVRNRGRRRVRLEIFDGLPAVAESGEMPWFGEVGGGENLTLAYAVKMMRRGEVEFEPTHVMRGSPLGLWRSRFRAGPGQRVKVYPNYEPVVRFALLAMDRRETQMGIRHRNRVGQSREFHQLRDYHEGDTLNQIDWKATAKTLRVVSREYREQRNQNVVIMVDCGRRMRALDGGLPQFDHALNAALLLSYVGLRQGDHVGMLGFGEKKRWLPPIKGAAAMTAVLNHLYDYEATLDPTDFAEGAEFLMAYQRRRSLVVMLTNLRSDDAPDITPALRLLRTRHVVVLGSLVEGSLDGAVRRPVGDLEGALLYGAAQLYFEERAAVLEALRAYNILTVDDTAARFPVSLANKYLEIKAAGLL